MVANILSTDTSLSLGWALKVTIQLFLEHRHLAYHIEGDDECNMQAHTISFRAPSTPRVGSKVKIVLLKVVMLHIKLIGMEHRAPCKHIFCPYIHPQSLGWGQKIKLFYFMKEPCLVTYPIKGNGA